MPYKVETMLMGGDAPNDTSTELCFNPPNGPFEGNEVTGTITTRGDEDWIAIELSEGKEYTITVATRHTMDADDTVDSDEDGTDDNDRDAGGLNDSVLKLLDGKGGVIDMNDDIDAAKGMLNSELKFTPEAGSGTQKYYISVSGYTGNPGANNTGGYTVSVSEKAVLAVGSGVGIPGTDNADKLFGTDLSESITGMGGDDTIDGMGGDDTIDGGDGNDLLIGGKGADKLTGGDGDMDTISYRGSVAGVTINLSDGTARGGDAEGDTISDDIENVIGSEHDDMLTGNRAVNSLWGLGGNDELDGGRRNDKLYGGAGDDMLDGGAGNDTLEGGYGADMLTGGEGDDTASYSMSMMGVTVRLHSGQAMGGDAEGDTWNLSVPQTYTNGDEEEVEVNLADIINLTGSANDDILAGDMRDNIIMGGAGNDRIYGGPNPADADTESDAGLSNADTLHGDGGDDRIFGGIGGDILRGGAGDDMLHGGPGNDTFWGGHGSDMIYADAMDTHIYGNRPDNTEPDGTVIDPATADVDESMEMEGDVDTVSYARLEEGITRTLGSDGTGSADATDGTNILIMGIENIIGTQGDDTITGDTGANVIEGGEGGDDLDGGDGIDTLSYESSDDWVRVTLNGASAATTSRGHASGDEAENFENLTGSAYDDDLTGDDVAAGNVIKGLAGDDDIEGMGGNDTIEGGAGADELDGGYTPVNAAGTDAGTSPADDGNRNFEANTLSYANSDAGVTVNLATASASGGHATGDTIATYEELSPTTEDPDNEVDVATFAHVVGSMYGDRLTGDKQDNHLTGGGGDDTLRSGAGADRVIGGPGADVLDGGEDMGEKNDMVPNPAFDATLDESDANPRMVAASVDWAVYKHAAAGVTVDLSTGMGTGGEAMGDTLMNIELIWGSEHADTFIASSGADTIEGDGGSDTVSYEASSMGVTVNLGESTQHRIATATGTGTEADPFVFPVDDPATVVRPTAGVPRLDAMGNPFVDGTNVEHEDDNPNANGAAGDRLGSIENLTGSNQKDMLTGDANPNVLKGMGGDDTLSGGTGGEDKLYGGDGDDMLTGSGSDGDMLDGGAGDDTIIGSTGDDTITGGAGDDDLSGGTGNDTFVFSTADAGDSDAILDYTAGDMIDLSAFNLTAAQVIEAISLRGDPGEGYVVINLEAHGGGRITIEAVNDLDTFDDSDVTTGDGAAATDDAINTLDEGIFIL